MRRSCAILAGVALVGLAAARPAQAVPRCQISLSPLAFGSYNPLSPHATDSAGAVTVACTGPGPVAVTLSASSGNAPDAGARALKAGPQALFYNLYRDAARQQVWGDGSNGHAPIALSIADPSVPVRVDIYGRIPPRQNVVPGSYADTILVTLSF